MTRKRNSITNIREMISKNVTTIKNEIYGIKDKRDVNLKTNCDKIKIRNILYSSSMIKNLLLIDYIENI